MQNKHAGKTIFCTIKITDGSLVLQTLFCQPKQGRRSDLAVIMPTNPTPPKTQRYSQPPSPEAFGRKTKGIHLTRMLSAVWRQAALEMKRKVNQRQVAQMEISDLTFEHTKKKKKNINNKKKKKK